MTMEIFGTKLQDLSFPDSQVTEMRLDMEQGQFEVLIDGAHLDAEDAHGGSVLPEGRLLIEDWESLEIRQFNPVSETWDNVPIKSADGLKDLCEVSFKTNIVLRGFSAKSGQWTEYKFTAPKRARFIC